MIELCGLSKSYKGHNGELIVLQDINLEIKDGEFLCIVGPSGCGKSTLMNIIAGNEYATRGKVLHNGKQIEGISSQRLVIFQELGLFPWLTVQKNVEFGLKFKKIPPKEQTEIAIEYLNMVNLVRFKDAYIHELSGGMKQRVALARALAINPEILLMDEPFAALDAQTRDMLHMELQKIWAKTKKTIIFITHNVREAVCLGDRVIVLSSLPAVIKSSFAVNLERPRRIEDHGLMEIARQILVDLRFDIQKAYEEELNAKENN